MKALQQLGLSQREACKSVGARRRSSREQPSTKAQRDAQVAVRLTQVAQTHAEHGCRRLYNDYERDAVDGDEYMNYKRFRRIYRLAGLQMGRRRRRGRAKLVRGRCLRRATKPFEGWTLDFIHDRLFNARAFRGLTIMDEFSRSGLALELAFSFPSRSVTAALDDLALTYGYPKYLRIDNGTELTSKVMQQWSEDHSVELLFIQPASRRRTPISNRSTRAFDPNSSTCIGSARCSMLGRLPPNGWSRTTRRTRTARLALARPRSSSHSTKLRHLHRNRWPRNGSEPTAIHEWFAAQVKDHGAHAMMMQH